MQVNKLLKTDHLRIISDYRIPVIWSLGAELLMEVLVLFKMQSVTITSLYYTYTYLIYYDYVMPRSYFQACL